MLCSGYSPNEWRLYSYFEYILFGSFRYIVWFYQFTVMTCNSKVGFCKAKVIEHCVTTLRCRGCYLSKFGVDNLTPCPSPPWGGENVCTPPFFIEEIFVIQSMIFVFRRNKFLLHTHNQRNCKQCEEWF